MHGAFSFWGALSGVDKNLRELNEKLERLMYRLDYLEAILMERARDLSTLTSWGEMMKSARGGGWSRHSQMKKE